MLSQRHEALRSPEEQISGAMRPIQRKIRPRVSPPRPGERFEAQARDLNSEGQAVVSHPSGRVVFVPGLWPGESGLCEIVSLRGRLGYAKLLELIERSPRRIEAPCPFHGFENQHCGGCAWQFMDYPAQLQAKQDRVARSLEKLGEQFLLEAIWPSPDILGYRNRAQFKTDGSRLGFVSAGTRELVDVQDCLVLNEHNRNTLQQLRRQLPKPQWKPRRGQRWTSLHVDDDVAAAEVTPNERRPFRQGNHAQNLRMRSWLAAQLKANPVQGPAVELFAGAGNFSDVLVESGATPLCAVDSFEPAVARLAERALPGVSTVCVDLSRATAPESLSAVLDPAELLFLDPPREGCRNIADFLARAPRLRSLIYVSCNPATLARDLEAATSLGFELRLVQPLDLFPHTPHVELMTVLQRDVSAAMP